MSLGFANSKIHRQIHIRNLLPNSVKFQQQQLDRPPTQGNLLPQNKIRLHSDSHMFQGVKRFCDNKNKTKLLTP